MGQKPFISVIITAYNRKEFILNAIKSALNQTLSKDKYEIIVIKNYNDNEIDDFINKNNIISIISDGIEGEYPYTALNRSNGEVLSFLDDDDLMKKNKLEIVYNTFNNRNNVGYYHNNFEVLMGNKIIHNKLINSPKYKTLEIADRDKNRYIYYMEKKLLYVNNSCISVRREILKQRSLYLRMQVANIDRFIYISALLSKFNLYLDNRILNSYRMHGDQTSILIYNNLDILAQKKLEFINKSLIAFNNILKMVHNSRFEGYVRTRITNLKLAYNFWFFGNRYKISLNDYLEYINNRDFSEIPRLIIYNTPKFIRKSIIKIIYKQI